MTTAEWEKVWAIFVDLWPRVAAELTTEECASYARVCSKFTEGECVRAFRGLRDTAARFPQPAAVGAALRADRQYRHQSVTNEQAELAKIERERERAENAEHWAMVRAMVGALTLEEREQHKAALLAGDWRLQWMKDQPVSSRGWMATIWKRICDGYQPSEPPRYEVPERPTCKAGNLLGEVAA